MARTMSRFKACNFLGRFKISSRTAKLFLERISAYIKAYLVAVFLKKKGEEPSLAYTCEASIAAELVDI
jgi:hypothetical protein